MSINLTDEIEVKTKKGKLGAAKQIFLEGDTQTVENEIQDINSRHNDLNSKHESLSSTVSEHTNQIESNQNQITTNKSTQDAKNASLDANMAELNTRDDQITELVRGIAATGGASVATTVTYDNTSSHLASATVQGAIDELQGSKIDKTSILQELGNAEDKVMSQKAVSDELSEMDGKVNELDQKIGIIGNNNLIPDFQNSKYIKAIISSIKLKSLAFTGIINRASQTTSQYLSFKAVKEDNSNVDLIYDSSKGSISNSVETIDISNSGITLTVVVNWACGEVVNVGINKPIDIRFVRFTDEKIIIDDSLESTNKDHALSAYQGKVLKETVTSEVQNLNNKINTLLDDSQKEQSFEFVKIKTAIIDSGEFSNPSYNSTDFIDVSAATKITLQNLYANQYGIRAYIFYADDKTTIVAKNSDVSTGDYIPDVVFDGNIPEGAKWLRCTEFYIAQNPSYKRGKVTITSLKEGVNSRISSLETDVKELKHKEVSSSRRKISDADILAKDHNYFYLDGGNVMKGASKYQATGFIAFNENIKAIEFELGDASKNNNFVSVLCGLGKDDNNIDVFARIDLPTFSSNTSYGNLQSVPQIYQSYQKQDAASLSGRDSYAPPYRLPFNAVYKPKTGDTCRIEIYNGTFMEGSVLVDGQWTKWFSVCQIGSYYNKSLPVRSGWNEKFVIGFAVASDSGYCTDGNVAIIKNIIVINDENDVTINHAYISSKGWTRKKSWLAIGDSITELNKTAGLGYIGFAERRYNFKSINKGRGGWTLYRYWRDRAGWYTNPDGSITKDTSGTFHEGNHWEEEVAALPKNSIVSIFMGTNDFDTTFAIPTTDVIMDTYPDPHPRFGNTDASSEDAKDEHTTLGCLRLIIERIMQLSPTARIVLFAPMYRTKGIVEGDHFTELLINSEGRTIYDYADAIASVGKEYNIPVYNTCRDSGINYNNLVSFTYDNLHTSEDGGDLLGNYIGSRLNLL